MDAKLRRRSTARRRDAGSAHRTGRNGSPPLLLVAQTEDRAPDSTDPQARATRTDRSPGSRVVATRAEPSRAFPPSGRQGARPLSSLVRSPLTVAGTAADQGFSGPLPCSRLSPQGHRRAGYSPANTRQAVGSLVSFVRFVYGRGIHLGRGRLTGEWAEPAAADRTSRRKRRGRWPGRGARMRRGRPCRDRQPPARRCFGKPADRPRTGSP